MSWTQPRLNMLLLAYVCISCMTGTAGAHSAAPDTIPTVLPTPEFRDKVSEEDAKRLAELDAISDPDLDVLLSSESEIDRAMGVWLIMWRGDLDRMLEYVHLIDDKRPTIPTTLYITPSLGCKEKYFLQDMTVGSYMNTAIRWWFGVSTSSAAEVRRQIPEGVDPYELVYPWLMRLLTVRQWGTPEELKVVNERISELRPELRWAVVVEAFANGEYTHAQALEACRRLPDSLFTDQSAAIDRLKPFLRSSYSPEVVARVHQKARELMEER